MAGEFVPELWSKEILVGLKKALVAMAITNQMWEGEIREMGDKVNITTPGPVTSKDYTEDIDIDAPETPTDVDTQLVIDQQNYFNFKVNKKLQIQSANKDRIAQYTQEAIYALRDSIDTYILSLYTGVATANVINTVGSGVLVTTANVYTLFNQAYTALDNANVPQEGRFVTVSPTIAEVIRAYWAGRSTEWGDKVSANGYTGRFAGFDIYTSNNVALVVESLTGTGDQNVYKCLGGRTTGITFANQVPPEDVTVYEPEKRFETAVKGLSIYGAKMVSSGVRNVLLNLAVS